MQSKATTVEAYLASLPEDRSAAIQAVRQVIIANLDKDYEEGMHYGMIGYFVPHRVYPPGYHCDPTQPLPFAGLGSQKNHLAIYLMCIYGSPAEEMWFRAAWAKSGKKLDLGKSCIRFKRIEDLPLEVIGETIRRVPAAKFIADYESARTAGAAKRKPAASKPAAKQAGRNAAVKGARKTAKKPVKKKR